MVGLGRMGGNMAQRLLKGGHRVVTYDQSPDAVSASQAQGAVGSSSLEHLLEQLSRPKSVWVMLPAGPATENTIDDLIPLLSPGGTILDGGNSNYKDTMRRGEKLAAFDIDFMDVGTSGGIWGLTEGYALMIGGRKDTYERLKPIFQTLSPGQDQGLSHVGPTGAGHFVKMVHNGIEYGLMQAYAEGFEIMAAKEEFNLDLGQIAGGWRHGSLVRSRLLELAASALEDDPKLENLQAYVEDSGEGRWMAQEAIDLAVPTPVITLSLQARFRSRQEEPLGARLLVALRNRFGGHAVRRTE